MSKIIIAVIIVVASMFAFTKLKGPKIIPSVAVQDQKAAKEVVVDEVVAVKDSWLVIQTNDEGVPGPVIGYKKIAAGSNKNVKVEIDKAKATPSLYAMIHEDDGTKGKFDFPENDQPLMYKMEMVAKTFSIN